MQKDPCFMVEVSRRLLEGQPNLSFVWVGDGELRPHVYRALCIAGVANRWSITGWVDNPYPLLRHADVFALPSAYESFGYTTLEAMILGIPVVATDVAGSRDLVDHGVTGYLVGPRAAM